MSKTAPISVDGHACFRLAPRLMDSHAEFDSSVDIEDLEIDLAPLADELISVDCPAHLCESSCSADCNGNALITLLDAACKRGRVAITRSAPSRFRFQMAGRALPRGTLYLLASASEYAGPGISIYAPDAVAEEFENANAGLLARV